MGNASRKRTPRNLTGPESQPLCRTAQNEATHLCAEKQPVRKKAVTIRDPLSQNWSLRGSIYRRNILRRPSDFSDIEQTTRGVQLSEREILLLRYAFPSESAATHEFALLMFQRLFKRHPAARTLFPDSKILHDADSPNECGSWWKEHASMVGNVLDIVLSSGLDALDDTIGPYLLAVGAKHAHIVLDDAADDLQQDCWDWLAQSMCETAADSWHIKQSRLETLCAWRYVVFFLIRKLRQGCDFERDLNLCHKTSVTDTVYVAAAASTLLRDV